MAHPHCGVETERLSPTKSARIWWGFLFTKEKSMQTTVEPALLTRLQAARYLGISITALDRHQEIPRVKLFGTRIMFEKAALDKEIEKYRLPEKKAVNGQ
jgi:hypothetical protein